LKSTVEYDVFISYRREGGETMALLLRDRLVGEGYRVFLDIESLNAGKFNTKLLNIIETCKDFIVILSEGSLDRCANDEDWVRTEIKCALDNQINIVPFILRGFVWPEELPEDISDLPMQNGINALSNEYFDAAIERLTNNFLTSVPQKKKSGNSDVHAIANGVNSVTKHIISKIFTFIIIAMVSTIALIIVIVIVVAIIATSNPEWADRLRELVDWDLSLR